MAKKRYTAGEIIHKLRDAEVLLVQGSSIAQACNPLGIADQTCYRWCRCYGGIRTTVSGWRPAF